MASELLEQIVEANDLKNKAMNFYQVVEATLNTLKDKNQVDISVIKETLVEANQKYFGNLDKYREYIEDLFPENFSPGDLAPVTIKAMKFIQEQSDNVPLSGLYKHDFVQNLVSIVVNLSQLDNLNKSNLLSSIHKTIETVIEVKKGALKHINPNCIGQCIRIFT